MNGSIVVLLVAFVLGSIPFGLLMARIFGGPDLRNSGSGNIGATNVTRVVGFWPAGFLTFLFDALKGTASVLLASSRFEGIWEGWLEFPAQHWQPGNLALIWTSGLLAVLGHCYSPWLKFRGGKGVATAFGVIAVLSPWAATVGALSFLLTFLSTRVGSLSSLVGLLLVAVTHACLPASEAGPHLWSGALILFVILVRHERNLDALLEGRESRF
jgi:acyl phosphate:glycerol-3-phosphate acyltransferase